MNGAVERQVTETAAIAQLKDNSPVAPDAQSSALQLLVERLGATLIIDYCTRCGRDYRPDGTSRRCDRSTS